jgi:uncharacterized membrane protein YqjE
MKLHILKQTFINFFHEHMLLSYIIMGIVGLPIFFLIFLGVTFLILFVLSLIFGKLGAVVVLLMILAGAMVGWLAYESRKR